MPSSSRRPVLGLRAALLTVIVLLGLGASAVPLAENDAGRLYVHLQEPQQQQQHFLPLAPGLFPPSSPVYQGPSAAPGRRLQGRFLHITDLHFDELYSELTNPNHACHHGSGPAGHYGAPSTSCDSPRALIDASLSWVADNLRDQVDFVVWTGDTARHDNDETLPRSAEEVLRVNRIVADHLADIFSFSHGTEVGVENHDGNLSKSLSPLAVPIIPSLGNNDFLPHNIFPPGPANPWLHHYLDVWRRFVPEEQRHTFRYGGWFYVEVIPGHLAVFSLNTMYFFDRNAAVDGCANPTDPGRRHLEWLSTQLTSMRARGVRAILTGHVPPARTDARRNWDESCWQMYMYWQRQFRDVIVVSLYGHMNIDHFMLHDLHEANLDLRRPSASLSSPNRSLSFSLTSLQDYLQDLRDSWSRLPMLSTFSSIPVDLDDSADGDWNSMAAFKYRRAKRFHLSLVSPSVVPNFFPTLRVFEYNITGLEDAAVWQDGRSYPRVDVDATAEANVEQDQYNAAEEYQEDDYGQDAAPAPTWSRTQRDITRHGPDPTLPNPPARGSPPGPAYSPQPLTLVGYTQYYANLTRLDAGARETPFAYEVEYATSSDPSYQLADLTVPSYMQLAHRISQPAPSDGHDDGKHRKKKGKKKKNKEWNEVWVRFLCRAFVSTVSDEELRESIADDG